MNWNELKYAKLAISDEVEKNPRKPHFISKFRHFDLMHKIRKKVIMVGSMRIFFTDGLTDGTGYI